MNIIQIARKLLREENGSTLLVTAISVPLLIGSSGLAMDTVQWSLWKRQLQQSADAGALAGAYAKAQSKNVSQAVGTVLAKDFDIAFTGTQVENAPTSGPFAGNDKAVRVTLETSRRLPFSGVFMQTPTIVAGATAAILSNGNHCVIALEDTPTVGITMKGNATVDLRCGMASNSSSTNAIEAFGSSHVVATPITAVGGLQPSSNYAPPSELRPYSLPQPDPYAGLPNPSASDFTPCSGKVSVNPSSTQTISPGCYRGMDLKGTVTLEPGVYFIDSSSFGIGSGASVSGTGVTIILTSSNATSNPGSIATVDINGGATINLTAPTSGTYAGVLMFQDRRANDSTSSNKINGNSSSKIEGGLYFPRQAVEFTGTTSMDTKCVQIVGRRVIFSGNSTVENDCPVGSTSYNFTGSVVRLVG